MSARSRQMRGPIGIALVLLLVIGLFPQAASADAIQKLARGVYNVAFGWTEIIYRPIAEPEDNHEVQRLLEGTARGVVAAVTRTTVGAVEVLTFPISAPWDGKPVIYPEYLDYQRSSAKNLAL